MHRPWTRPLLPRALLSLLLTLLVLASGCAMPPRAPVDPGGAATCGLHPDDGAPHGEAGLQPVRHHRAAKYALAGFLIALVVTIDLLILPFTVHHHPFPCCRAALRMCH